jgi:hypothetical protein
MVPALMLIEEMTSFALDHQPAFSLDCVNYFHQEDIKAGLQQGMKPACKRGPEELHREMRGVYTVDKVTSVFDSLKFSLNLC